MAREQELEIRQKAHEWAEKVKKDYEETGVLDDKAREYLADNGIFK